MRLLQSPERDLAQRRWLQAGKGNHIFVHKGHLVVRHVTIVHRLEQFADLRAGAVA